MNAYMHACAQAAHASAADDAVSEALRAYISRRDFRYAQSKEEKLR